jgi:Family of unknown function (DUF5993)
MGCSAAGDDFEPPSWDGAASRTIKIRVMTASEQTGRAAPRDKSIFAPAGPRIYRRLGRHSLSGPTMEFTALFLAMAIVMLVAWRGPRPLALGLFAVVMIACVATYLHHATDTLKLSF